MDDSRGTKNGIVEQTYYRRPKEYSGLKVD
jgi:hypothetical protein